MITKIVGADKVEAYLEEHGFRHIAKLKYVDCYDMDQYENDTHYCVVKQHERVWDDCTASISLKD